MPDAPNDTDGRFNSEGLVLATDAKRVEYTGWRLQYGWLLIMRERRELGGATHYRDLAPEVTVEGARHVAREEMAANPRLHWIIIRCKDFDPYVDRWSRRGRYRPERDHDLVPERVRLDAELEDT